MNKIFILISVLFFTGCDSSMIKDKLNPQEENNNPIVETDGTVIRPILTRSCKNIKKLHYPTEASLQSYWRDIQYSEMFWDTRYTNDEAAYICNPNMAFSTVVDTRSSGEIFGFGGPQSTIIYRPKQKDYPWVNNQNLMMQVEFTGLSYQNFNTNLGGNVSFNFFIANRVTKERINYVISVYALNNGWREEQKDILWDPSTQTNFVSTVVNKGTKYSTISNISSVIDTQQGFFRVNVSSEDLTEVILKINEQSQKNSSVTDLYNWYVDFISIQFELEEEGGDARLTGSFKNFEAYITTSPM